jgi:hypothetical protein
MPAATLHITHAELLSHDAGLAEPLRLAMERELTCTRLGSVLVDLPFYTNIVKMMLGYWLEMPAENCPFAQKMHRYHPDLFTWHFLKEARKEAPLSHESRLAVVAGFLSHLALDLEIHPLVNWCARRDVILCGGNESHHHRLTEKYQSLFFHCELQGHDIIGTRRVFTETTRIVDHAAFFRVNPEPPVVRWCTDLLAGFFHESAPSMRQFARWIRAFRHFGFMVSLPWARQNSEKLGNPANRERYFENAEFSFMEHYERAYRRSIELMNLGFEVYERGDFSDEQRDLFLSRARICNLAEPPEFGRLPSLPAYRELALEQRGLVARS